MHGFGCWFDIEFQGTDELVTLSTSPDSPGTHWYQCQILLQEPLAVNKGQIVEGSLDFKSNNKFSYDIYITSNIKGTEIQSTNLIHLHDQVLYFYLCEDLLVTLCYYINLGLSIFVLSSGSYRFVW